MVLRQAEEVIIDLVRLLPNLILTGSRYFGTAQAWSDWDFILPASKEDDIPIYFNVKTDHSYRQSDPFWITVYESYGLGVQIHIQVVPDEDIPLRIRAMEILRSTGALNGIDKDLHKNIWKAILLALSDDGIDPEVPDLAEDGKIVHSGPAYFPTPSSVRIFAIENGYRVANL
jgi:hypothetical protein